MKSKSLQGRGKLLGPGKHGSPLGDMSKPVGMWCQKAAFFEALLAGTRCYVLLFCFSSEVTNC